MTSRSKIVDLRSQGADGDAPLELSGAEEAYVEQEAAEHDAVPLTDWDMISEYEEETPKRRWTGYIVPSLLVVALLGWIGFFGWTYRGEFVALPANERIVTLITTWAIPTLLITALWLLWMRSSAAEATRFGDAAALLRQESEALENRMRTVNEEIVMAREFLAQNARELETVGRQSAQHLTEAATQLGVALADSDAKAKTLEQVSDAATSNLEQLRKHLPVVTSAAKDVTNQIGNAGNAAQVQAKSLIAALTRVADAGHNARESIGGLEAKAGEVTSLLDTSTAENESRLAASIGDAETRVGAMSQQMTETAERMRGDLEQVTQQLDSQIEDTAGRVQQLTTDSSAALETQVSALRKGISQLREQSEAEQARIGELLATISNHIEGTAKQIEIIDEQSTERTAKLAFALSALDESTRSVGSSIERDQSNADRLIASTQTLLASLQQASEQIGTALPAASQHMETQFAQNLAQLETALAHSQALGDHSEDLLAKTRSVESLIEAQRAKVDALMAESDVHFVARHEQADALSAALTRTRDVIEEMSGETSDRIVASLLRVRETAKQAAESSREAVEGELAHVAERLGEQNHNLLSHAIDAQVASIGDMISQSIERNIALSENATAAMSQQLAQIDEMTANLEKRVEQAQAGFEGIESEGFARRMALLTESLNSTAIDVAKILSNEVTDTAWASYLKGDRGVFTRRAVRLLDAGEARTIASHYDEDPEFREHVNRYIHDFESMMRVLLSTRDGNAIGVTLLSSDVGKLYVALAQAIERLRN